MASPRPILLLLHILLPLQLGAFVYIFIKPNHSVLGNWSLELFNHHAIAAKIASFLNKFFPTTINHFIRNSLADAC
jgi:hypothetical protein